MRKWGKIWAMQTDDMPPLIYEWTGTKWTLPDQELSTGPPNRTLSDYILAIP